MSAANKMSPLWPILIQRQLGLEAACPEVSNPGRPWRSYTSH
jgi:hypothetical protein